MRVLFLGITLVFVLLPTLLILFAPQKPIRARVLWGLGAFLSPVVTFAAVRMIPILSNNTPEAAQWERFFGVVVSGGGFILPWILFALFLHRVRGR